MARRIGMGIGLGVSAAALVVGGLNMEGRYNDELASDRANAAVAEAFLANHDAVEADILKLVAGANGKISHFAETVGEACMAVIDETDSETIDDVVAKSKCELDEDQVDEARGILRELQAEKADLTYWTEPDAYSDDGLTGLESVAKQARSAVKDAADSSPINDLVDMGPMQTISVRVEDGKVLTTETTGNKYDIAPPLGFVIVALVGAMIVEASRETQTTTEEADSASPHPVTD